MKKSTERSWRIENNKSNIAISLKNTDGEAEFNIISEDE